ncbi:MULTISPECIES: hypothetical protein [unclassified Myxococcus]|nr:MULTISPECIES: hypothetical protein [unclassified Myxococcus]
MATPGSGHPRHAGSLQGPAHTADVGSRGMDTPQRLPARRVR